MVFAKRAVSSGERASSVLWIADGAIGSAPARNRTGTKVLVLASPLHARAA